MAEIKSYKILKGLDEISGAMNLSKPTVLVLIKIGLPVVQINGTWYGHIEVLEEYFAQVCSKHRGKVYNIEDFPLENN